MEEHHKQTKKLVAKYRNDQRENDNKLDRVKKRLVAAQQKVVKDRAKWQEKLYKLNKELDKSSDRVYAQKRKARDAIAAQLQKAKKLEIEILNYIEGLEELNDQLQGQCKDALSAKKSAQKESKKAKALAQSRLEKWHAERNERRELQDELVRQAGIKKETESIIGKYKSLLSKSQQQKKL